MYGLRPPISRGFENSALKSALKMSVFSARLLHGLLFTIVIWEHFSVVIYHLFLISDISVIVLNHLSEVLPLVLGNKRNEKRTNTVKNGS